MSQLTPTEIRDMKHASDAFQAMHPEVREATRRSGRVVADILREELPDIDDVTIGRVLRVLGSYVGRVADSRTMNTLADTLIVAMLELTEIERGEASQQ